MDIDIESLQKNFINGEWIGDDATSFIDVINPSSLERIGGVPDCGIAEATLAVEAAERAFTTWHLLSASEREIILVKAANIMEREREKLATIITKEQGKPLAESKGEIDYGIDFVRWYASEGRRLYGEIIPSSDVKKRQLVFREPVGPTLLVSSGNDPFAMITRKGAPALAAGCTLVVKPHRETPFSALAVAKIFEEAGLPQGGINVITTTRSTDVVEFLLKHPGIRHLTFTGSSEVGKILGGLAGAMVKGMTLELGGHAPFVVFEDADISLAADDLLARKYTNAGQTCSCPARIFLHESIEKVFLDQFVEKVKKITVGDGFDPAVTMGPLQNEGAVRKAERHVADAVEKGGQLVVGEKQQRKYVGNFLTPSVLVNSSDDMLIMQEETFGPVAAFTTFQTESDLFRRMNHSTYGLTGYCYTANLSRAFRLIDNLSCGFIGINDRRPQGVEVPMGGIGDSGIGREGGHWGIEEFTHIKYASIRV